MTLDVANVLGIIGTQTITERLDEDEVGFTDLINNIGRLRRTSIISESGLYAALARSSKPAAKDLQRSVALEITNEGGPRMVARRWG